MGAELGLRNNGNGNRLSLSSNTTVELKPYPYSLVYNCQISDSCTVFCAGHSPAIDYINGHDENYIKAPKPLDQLNLYWTAEIVKTEHVLLPYKVGWNRGPIYIKLGLRAYPA